MVSAFGKHADVKFGAHSREAVPGLATFNTGRERNMQQEGYSDISARWWSLQLCLDDEQVDNYKKLKIKRCLIIRRCFFLCRQPGIFRAGIIHYLEEAERKPSREKAAKTFT